MYLVFLPNIHLSGSYCIGSFSLIFIFLNPIFIMVFSITFKFLNPCLFYLFPNIHLSGPYCNIFVALKSIILDPDVSYLSPNNLLFGSYCIISYIYFLKLTHHYMYILVSRVYLNDIQWAPKVYPFFPKIEIF